MDDLSKLPAQIYRFHCCGIEVSKIARQLSLDDDFVRETIVARWYEDKVEATIESKLKSVRR